MINVPLAATAVSVVPPGLAAMASGANSTFRQLGIATGVATLGSVLSSRFTGALSDGLAGTPLAARGNELGAAIAGGHDVAALAGVAPQQRGLLAQAARQGFATALDDISLVAALVCLVAAAATLLLIRQRDFAITATHGHPSTPAPVAPG